MTKAASPASGVLFVDEESRWAGEPRRAFLPLGDVVFAHIDGLPVLGNQDVTVGADGAD